MDGLAELRASPDHNPLLLMWRRRAPVERKKFDSREWMRLSDARAGGMRITAVDDEWPCPTPRSPFIEQVADAPAS